VLLEETQYKHSERSLARLRLDSTTIVTAISCARAAAIYDVHERRGKPTTNVPTGLPLDFNSLHVSGRNFSVVIDPMRFDDDDFQMLERGHAHYTQNGNGTSAAFNAIGLSREDVTHVIVTHAHADHFSGVTMDAADTLPTFPHAHHFVSRLDWESVGKRHRARLHRSFRALEARGLHELVDGDLQVAPGLELVCTPGETPGHMAVRIASKERPFVWTGDLFHHAAEVRHLDWVNAALSCDSPDMERTIAEFASARHRILTEAVTDGSGVSFAHAPLPTWGSVTQDGDLFEWTLFPPDSGSQGPAREEKM